METWPLEVLPDIAREPYGMQETPSVLRTQMDSGRVRQVARFTTRLVQVPVSWRLVGEQQFRIFQAWYTHKISRGADWFLLDLPFGSGLEQCTVRFMEGVYSVSRDDNVWVVTTTLEVDIPPTMTEGQLDDLLGGS